MAMKLGAAAWCFTDEYGAPYDKGIRTVGELGYQGFELIVKNPLELNQYYTSATIKGLRSLANSYKLSLSQFVIYHDVIEGLTSLDPSVQAEAIENFRECTRIAKELGCDLVDIVPHWLPGASAPVSYLPFYVHPNVVQMRSLRHKLKIDFPRDIDWSEIWENYVKGIRLCVEVASQEKVRVAMEPHANVIIGGTDAYVHLFDRIPSPILGVNFDTAWLLIQREYLPFSVYKLKGRIFHMHVRDGDGQLCYNLIPGEGIIDWKDLVQALRHVGYDGFLSLEISDYENPREIAVMSRKYLQSVLEE
jgi:sugar phosphate isomerase/epimerase